MSNSMLLYRKSNISFFVFLLLVTFSFQLLNAQNKTHVLIVDTNNVVRVDDKEVYVFDSRIGVDYYGKKIDDKIYLMTDDVLNNERIYYFYDLKSDKMYQYCKHIVMTKSFFDYSIHEIRDGDTCLISLRDGGNSIQFVNKSFESLITYFSIVNYQMRISDFMNGFVSYSPSYRSLQIVKNGKNVILKDNMFSIKHGFNFVYSTIVNGDYIIYIEGVENPLLADDQSIPQKRKIKVFDVLKNIELDYELVFFDAYKIDYNKATLELLVMTKGYNENFSTVYVYSLLKNKCCILGKYQYVCWL